MQGATMGEDDPQTQPAPEYEFDVRIACQVLRRVQAHKRKGSEPDELPLPVVSGLVPAVIRRHWPGRNSEDFAGAPGARFEIDAP